MIVKGIMEAKYAGFPKRVEEVACKLPENLVTTAKKSKNN